MNADKSPEQLITLSEWIHGPESHIALGVICVHLRSSADKSFLIG
jgi:hypothetical protein